MVAATLLSAAGGERRLPPLPARATFTRDLASCYRHAPIAASLQGYGRVLLPLQAKVYADADVAAKHGVSLRSVDYLLMRHGITGDIRVMQAQVRHREGAREGAGGRGGARRSSCPLQ